MVNLQPPHRRRYLGSGRVELAYPYQANPASDELLAAAGRALLTYC